MHSLNQAYINYHHIVLTTCILPHNKQQTTLVVIPRKKSTILYRVHTEQFSVSAIGRADIHNSHRTVQELTDTVIETTVLIIVSYSIGQCFGLPMQKLCKPLHKSPNYLSTPSLPTHLISVRIHRVVPPVLLQYQLETPFEGHF